MSRMQKGRWLFSLFPVRPTESQVKRETVVNVDKGIRHYYYCTRADTQMGSIDVSIDKQMRHTFIVPCMPIIIILHIHHI